MKDLNGETLHFGDIIRNEWAGDGNPHKVVMFIKATKRYVNWIALDGSQGQTYRRDHRIRKIYELDLSKWMQLAEAHIEARKGTIIIDEVIDAKKLFAAMDELKKGGD